MSGKGAYVLITRLPTDRSIRVGRFGSIDFKRGYYCYVGSAFGPGGIAARLAHHLDRAQKPRWHIDYLRRHAVVIETWYAEDRQHREHQWAAVLASMPSLIPSVRGFGASDCRCQTHLYYSQSKPVCGSFAGLIADRHPLSNRVARDEYADRNQDQRL